MYVSLAFYLFTLNYTHIYFVQCEQDSWRATSLSIWEDASQKKQVVLPWHPQI